MYSYRKCSNQNKRLRADRRSASERRARSVVAAHAGLALLTACVLAGWPAIVPAAQSLQSHQSIREAARHFLASQPAPPGSRAQISVGHLDPRLRLAHCGKPLEAFRSPGARPYGTTSVGIRCTVPHPWKLYLPATVRVLRPVVVSTRPLARGALVGSQDVTLAERDLSRMSFGYLEHIADAVGKQVKRPVTGGIALTPSVLAAPRLVHRGEQVTIVAGVGGIEVRMGGVALADGGRNDVIQVRNSKTHRVIEGTVEAAGVVRVRM